MLAEQFAFCLWISLLFTVYLLFCCFISMLLLAVIHWRLPVLSLSVHPCVIVHSKFVARYLTKLLVRISLNLQFASLCDNDELIGFWDQVSARPNVEKKTLNFERHWFKTHIHSFWQRHVPFSGNIYSILVSVLVYDKVSQQQQHV